MDHTYLHDRDFLWRNQNNYDVVNIGFGPAGIALACVQEDARSVTHLTKILRCCIWKKPPILSGMENCY